MLKLATPIWRAEPGLLGLGQRAHGLGKRRVLLRPMHQEQIDIVDAERGQAGIDRTGKIAGVQIFVRYLGAQENVRPRHAGGAHAFADHVLGAVFPRRVDMAIAGLERGCDMLGTDVAHAGGAEADSGNFGAVRREFWGKGHRRHLKGNS